MAPRYYVPLILIVVGITCFLIGWQSNIHEGLKGKEVNGWMIIGNMASLGTSYLFLDPVVRYFERRQKRSI